MNQSSDSTIDHFNSSLPTSSVKAKSILFVSEIYPVNTHASSVLLYRHLLSIEKQGFEIIVVLPENPSLEPLLPKQWIKVILPNRKFYYPPYRHNSLLKEIRWLLFYRLLKPIIAERNIHCIIGLLMGEYIVLFCRWLAHRLNTSFFLFFHDQGELLHGADNPESASRIRSNNLHILSSPLLKRVWTVSPELIYNEVNNRNLFSVVFPLPDSLSEIDRAVWNDSLSTNISIVYAGAVYENIIPTLKIFAAALSSINGKLVIFTPTSEHTKELTSQFPSTIFFAGNLPTNELLQCISTQYSAFLVVYPESIAEMPWSINLFPSKFTQLVQTGLPGVVLASREISISKWCIAHKWSLYTNSYKKESLAELLSSLKSPASWKIYSKESIDASNSDFNPSSIEQSVLNDIIKLG